MKLSLIAIGKTDDSYLKEGIAHYAMRLKRYLTLEIIELPGLKNAGSLGKEQYKAKEAEMLFAKWPKADIVCLLDENGKSYTSVEFAEYLQASTLRGKSHLAFIIGGPYGFTKEAEARADHKISLSKMTFNHQMVRLFFVEQVYRAMSILNKEPYHNE
ncbi:MAG: 23S rRNA (pseudouridine(1915)-N(3))-methyltransferase RlmH [Bacteroidota bacterium]